MSKCGERRLTAFFSRLPAVEPEINIHPLQGERFEVDYREPEAGGVPLEIGAEGFYADYGAGSRRLREATKLRVARRVQVRGMWCLEMVGVGGAPTLGRFELSWAMHKFYRMRRGYAYLCDLLEPEERRRFPFPRHLAPDEVLQWSDTETVNGPETNDPYFSGYCLVTVGGHDHECMRVIWPSPDREGPFRSGLDEVFISKHGRSVLVRRFALPQYLLKDRLGPPDGVDDDSVGESKITYNGTTFQHWFDMLTDVSLGPSLKPRCRFGTRGFLASRAGAL